jgi:hypothetical protein
MFFVVSVQREDETAVVSYIPDKTCAASIKIVFAIGLPKSFLLAVIVIEVVTQRPNCSIRFCVVAIIVVAAKHILGGEMKRRVLPRHFHDEIERPTGLRPEL